MATNNGSFPWRFVEHISHELNAPLLEGLVGATCGLSIVGSLFIIITFICFPQIRSTGRLLLVNLSVMDFLTAAANLVGVCISFHKRLNDQPGNHDDYSVACQIQAQAALFSTNSSIFWTNALALYLLIILVSKRPKVARYSTYVMYIVCYGLPLVLCVVLGVDRDLGLDNSTAGWCSIKEKSGSTAPYYPFLVGNDIWVMASFVFLPTVYILMKLYIWRVKYKIRKGERSPLLSSSNPSYDRVKVVEWKLMLVPLFFLVLHVWSLAVDIHLNYRRMSIPEAHYWLFYVGAVGDSGQGFLNGVLWCAMSMAVWQRVCACTKSCGRKTGMFCVSCCVSSKGRVKALFPKHTHVQSIQPSPRSTPLDSYTPSEFELSHEVQKIKY